MDDKDYRDAGTGRFVTEEYAAANPDTTVSETRPARLPNGPGDGVKILPADLEKLIVGERIVDHGTLTVCILTLDSGFTVVGTSGCIDPQNYNRAMGERVAREKAVDQLWQLEGYRLSCEMQAWRRGHLGWGMSGIDNEMIVATHEATSSPDCQPYTDAFLRHMLA